MLQSFRLQADTAQNGDEAVNLVRHRLEHYNTTYRLIMMDYSMPFKNGGEATREIRELLFNAAPDLP